MGIKISFGDMVFAKLQPGDYFTQDLYSQVVYFVLNQHQQIVNNNLFQSVNISTGEVFEFNSQATVVKLNPVDFRFEPSK